MDRKRQALLVIAFVVGMLVSPVRHVIAAGLAGVVWAVVAWPVYKLARGALPGTPAAVLTLVFTAMLVIAPLVLLASLVVHDLGGLDPKDGLAAAESVSLPGSAFVLKLLASTAAKMPARLSAAGWLAFLQVPLMVTSAFLSLRKGRLLWLRLLPHLPLPAVQSIDLSVRVRTTLRGVARGQVLTALAKGGAGALGFAIAGVPGVVLWGSVMAVFTFLPVLAAWMVWLPAAWWLQMNGHTEAAIFLALWGAFVMGLLDNVLRPMLVGGEARIHPFFAMVGMALGAAGFGLVGLIAGPVLVDALVQALHARRTGQLPATEAPLSWRAVFGDWRRRAVRWASLSADKRTTAGLGPQ